jgi:glutamate synthase domain-containing protein 3
MIGRADLLEADGAIEHWKARGIDLSALLAVPDMPEGTPRRRVRDQEPVLDDALDWTLVEEAKPAIESGQAVTLEHGIRNVNRCVGGILSSHIAQAHGADGLPEGTIDVQLRGSAGQSFGGWLAPGVSFTLTGDANDYTGKGLSGGVLAVRPPSGVSYAAEDNVIIGNTSLYGATSGRAFFRGLAGERFAVRNSGASAVVEGVGDHGCEYMTGGRVVVLGPTGRNFAAGMSGGLAFVLDEDGTFASRCNPSAQGDLMPLDEADAIELHALVSEHVARTGSPVGQRVLDEFETLREKFVKVFPADYRRVLEQREADEVAA